MFSSSVNFNLAASISTSNKVSFVVSFLSTESYSSIEGNFPVIYLSSSSFQLEKWTNESSESPSISSVKWGDIGSTLSPRAFSAH